MKNKGFTLIECMIVLAIIGIIIIATLFLRDSSAGHTISMGANGIIEERCISGYKFVIGGKGQPTQIFDQFGKGVPCND